jgi:hypothetical protein
MTQQPIMVPIQGVGSKTTFEEVVLIEATKKLVMGIGAIFQEPEMNLAWQKSMEMGWIRLWDLQPVLPNPKMPQGPTNLPVPCRVFKITNSGQERLREIQRRKEIDTRLKNNA